MPFWQESCLQLCWTYLHENVTNYWTINLSSIFCRWCFSQWQSQICDTCSLNKLPTVSTSQNCLSESPWECSDRQMLTLVSGCIPNPLDMNCWPSLGLGVDSAAPRLFSLRRSLESKGVHSEPRDLMGGLSCSHVLIRLLETL